MRNTNEMKPLNMKRAKPKTYRDEMSFWLICKWCYLLSSWITIASGTKKHITVGLHLVMNMEVVWIKVALRFLQKVQIFQKNCFCVCIYAKFNLDSGKTLGFSRSLGVLKLSLFFWQELSENLPSNTHSNGFHLPFLGHILS